MPLPEPLPPVRIVIQVAPLTAVQLQDPPPLAVTFMLPLPPAAGNTPLVEETEKVQGMAVKLAIRPRFDVALKL